MNRWLNDALCRRHLDAGGDDLWFTKGRHLEAIDVCKTCPVLPDCMEYALNHVDGTEGVMGGLTGRQRTRIVAQRRRTQVAA